MLKKITSRDRIILRVLFALAVIMLYYIDYEPISIYRSERTTSFFLQEKAWGMALWNSLTCFPFAYLNLKLIAYLEQTEFVKSRRIRFKMFICFMVIIPFIASLGAYIVYFFLVSLKDNITLLNEIYKIQFASTEIEGEMWYRNIPENVFIIASFLSITENRDLEVEKNLLEMKINLLKKRMEPHFIIGVLNDIFLEINEKLPNAAEHIYLLSNQLRYVLKESEQKEVLLKDEVAFVRDYIRLKKLQHTNKQVEIEDRMILTDFAEDRKIMPLMLVEFVENAFKYSYDVQGKRYIRLYLYADEDNKICIRIENKRPLKHNRPDISSTKEGLKNLKSRLQMTYPDAHQFSVIEDDPYKYTISLTIDSKTA